MGFVVVCLGLLPAAADAGNGGHVSLPFPGIRNRSGLRLDIDSRWVSGSGYRPVRVRISPQPLGPAPADRTIEVRIRPKDPYYGARSTSVMGTVELKQGALYGETILSVPETNTWFTIKIETYEDGWKFRELSADGVGMGGRYGNYMPDDVPAIVVVDPAADDRTGVLAGGVSSNYFAPPGAVRPMYVGPQLILAPPGYSVLPFLVITPNPWTGAAFSNQIGVMQVVGKGGSILPIDTRILPDIRALAGRFPAGYYNVYGANTDVFSTKNAASDAEIQRLVSDLSNLDLIPPNLLPDRWFDYTNIDVLVISRGDLLALREQFPDKLRAMVTWLRYGATLCVYGAGADFEHLAEIEKLLTVEPSSDASSPNSPRPGWLVPNAKDYTDHVAVTAGGNATRVYMPRPGVMVQQTGQGNATPAPPSKAPDKVPFVMHRVAQGQLVAMSAQEPFPGSEFDWSWMFNSLPSRNWLSYQRHGVSQYSENMQFWAFLVEGIGRAPVKSFLALITIFAILIGPVNYYALRRRGRLYLLLVTVPVGAVAVAGGLFLFAMVGDGLGTRARLRSYTELDQRDDRAMTWSRQTYYAGFAPSRGLSFPATAAVFPVEHRPLNQSGMEDNRRELEWTDRQDLVAGYITSRTMAQFVVMEPAETELRVRIEESAEGKPPQVTNELGVSILRLALCDFQGRMFETQSLNPGQQATAAAMDREVAGANWRSRYRAHRPEYPEGFNPRALDDVTEFFAMRRWRPSSTLPDPAFEVSVLETGIREALDRDFENLTPRSFVAILARSPFVSLGVEKPSVETGFHVVVGRW